MNVFNLYINSSIHVATAVVAFYLVTLIELQLSVSWDLLFFLFFATITGYNFVKYAGIAQLYHLRLTNNLRIIQLFSLLSFLLTLYFALKLVKELWISITVLALLNAFYAIPVFKSGKNLRAIPLVKVFIIALVWTFATVCISLQENQEQILYNPTYLWYAVQRFLMLVCLMIPFEIRDMRFDEASIKTLPQFLGIQNTKLLGITLLISCSFISYVILEPTHFTVQLCVLLLLLFFILKSCTQQPRYFASFWVESTPIVYAILCIFYF